MMTLTEATEVVQKEYAAWIVGTDADIADAVMIAANVRYMLGEYRQVCKDEPYTHMSECRAKYRSAYNVEMALSQAEAFGKKWNGVKR